MLDHQHRVGAARQHAARRDRRRDAGDDGIFRHDTRRQDFVVERDRPRRFLHRAERIARLHGETVDVGTIETGNIHFSDDIVGQHATERVHAGAAISLPSGASVRCSRKRAVASSRVTTFEELRLAGIRLRAFFSGSC